MTPILELREVSHVYSAGTPFECKALDRISLSVLPGEFIGLIGHTGSGKSTLIQHLNGLLRPTSGQVLLNGADIWSKNTSIRDVRFRVGLVFQYPEYQLFEETVAKDIAYGPTNMGLPQDEIARRVEDAMQAVGLPPELGGASPFALSGGQKRRAAIAGIIAMNPEVLVLDEPTAGLDPAGRAEIFALLDDLHRGRGMTIVLVTHSMEDAARVASRMIVLRSGTVLTSGTPAETFSQAELLEQAGLDIPQITRVMLELRRRGYHVDPACYTVEQAYNALRAYRKEGV
ncbi:MAG: energy-coupling factor transporter ATPase [Butyricicoccaceae bacterium]